MKYLFGVSLMLGLAAVSADEPPAKRSPKEALQPLNDLIGIWQGTGIPEGTREEKQRGFWTETVKWEWRFKGNDAWLKVVFDKGKYFTNGELRYLPDKDLFQLSVTTPDKETLVFAGPLKERRLTLDRLDEKKQETQRLVITVLHDTRFLYHYEVKPRDKSLFSKLYQVGATREGVAFAVGSSRPECVVTGGLGTIRVTYKDQTYYVCCSGCRDVFNEEPEKCLKEYEARKAKEKK